MDLPPFFYVDWPPCLHMACVYTIQTTVIFSIPSQDKDKWYKTYKLNSSDSFNWKISKVLKSTQILYRGLTWFFFWIISMTPNFFQAATLKKDLGRFYKVPFKSILRVHIKRAKNARNILKITKTASPSKQTNQLHSSLNMYILLFKTVGYFSQETHLWW